MEASLFYYSHVGSGCVCAGQARERGTKCVDVSGLLCLLCMCAAIREEIREIEEGKYDKENNVMKVTHFLVVTDDDVCNNCRDHLIQ